MDYFGNMELTVIDEQSITTFAGGDRGMSGQPGSGDPGMPGKPVDLEEQYKTGCIRTGFRIVGWNGNESAMEYVQRRHGDTKCYGKPDNAFSLTMLQSPLYNTPPISTKDEYYQYYGCQLVTVGYKKFPTISGRPLCKYELKPNKAVK